MRTNRLLILVLASLLLLTLFSPIAQSAPPKTSKEDAPSATAEPTPAPKETNNPTNSTNKGTNSNSTENGNSTSSNTTTSSIAPSTTLPTQTTGNDQITYAPFPAFAPRNFEVSFQGAMTALLVLVVVGMINFS